MKTIQLIPDARRVPLSALVSVMLSSAMVLVTHDAHAGLEVVRDAQAQAVARQILEDYREERRRNVPRWADLAHDENTGKQADCVRSRGSKAQPVTLKDCHAEHAKVSEQRWDEVMQSWAVLDAGQKADVAQVMAPLFESLGNNHSTSLAGKTVKEAYKSGSGDGVNPGSTLRTLLDGLLQIDGGSDKLIAALLEGTGAKGSGIFTGALAAHTEGDLANLLERIKEANRRFSGLGPDASNQTFALFQRAKLGVDTNKTKLAETANVARISKNRAEVVKDITSKISALGSSGADQSLVSAQLAQLEFYLETLNALGLEEQIKSAAQSQGEQAQEKLTIAALEAERQRAAILRASRKGIPGR